MLIDFGVDDPDFAIVFAGILTTVPNIEKFGVGVVGNTVGTQVQLDRVQQVESVAAENAEHPVISTGHEHFIEGANINDALCFLKTGDAFQPFASAQIDDFQRAILESGHKEPLAFDIYIHVVNAAFNAWHGNCLHQLQGGCTLGVREHRQSEKQTDTQAVRFHFTSLNVGE